MAAAGTGTRGRAAAVELVLHPLLVHAQLGDLALDLLHPIYATLYVQPWYRALGAGSGARAEISTATSVVHDLVDIGAESFIADGVVFGDAGPNPIDPAGAHADRAAHLHRQFGADAHRQHSRR